MFTCVFVVIVTSSLSNAEQPLQYECGSHGKFEYCIDDIPGCVVGCHCHPGYYFDTDTKICEANTKLVQHFRRSDFIQPATIETTTISSKLNAKVEEVAQNTDDLGDWLYNQFFKTIENQIINKTAKEVQPTRRSGGGDSAPVKNKKNKRKSKSKSNKRKRKKAHFRSKGLRIGADDSLFDDDTDEVESTSTSEESDSSDGSYNKHSGSTSNEDGEYRKIVMINKRPSLPSYMFLPGGGTHFFPPMGFPMPPPPPLMFPMVPVPPVIYPPNSQSTCGPPQQSSGTTTTSSTKTTATTTKTTTSSTTTTTSTTTNTTPTTKAGRRRRLRRKHKLNFDPLLDDESLDDDPNQMERAPTTNPEKFNNFKYLTELIHRKNKSIGKNPPTKIPMSQMMDQAPKPSISGRRIGQAEAEQEESYYSKLGRAIASLIRQIDSRGERQINMEIEEINDGPDEATYFRNNFSPGTYWERSVRSPVRKKYSDSEDEYLKDSYEELFDLENEVAHVASTTSKLSLSEIENVVSLIGKAKQINKKSNKQPLKRSDGYLKFSLLQANEKTSYRKKYNANTHTTDSLQTNKKLMENTYENVNKQSWPLITLNDNKNSFQANKKESYRNKYNANTYTTDSLLTKKKLMANTYENANKQSWPLFTLNDNKNNVQKIVNNIKSGFNFIKSHLNLPVFVKNKRNNEHILSQKNTLDRPLHQPLQLSPKVYKYKINKQNVPQLSNKLHQQELFPLISYISQNSSMPSRPHQNFYRYFLD